MEQSYSKTTLAIGVGVAIAIVLVGIVCFNIGEISGIIQSEGLLSK